MADGASRRDVWILVVMQWTERLIRERRVRGCMVADSGSGGSVHEQVDRGVGFFFAAA
jgi:hypothetical protein